VWYTVNARQTFIWGKKEDKIKCGVFSTNWSAFLCDIKYDISTYGIAFLDYMAQMENMCVDK
jgi:hypothetical protein